jgi:activator of HSP90 ATPase
MIMIILNQWNGYVLKPSTRNFTLSELQMEMEIKTKDDKTTTYYNDITVPDDVYKPYQNCADGSVISSGESTESTVMASSSVIEQVGDSISQ